MPPAFIHYIYIACTIVEYTLVSIFERPLIYLFLQWMTWIIIRKVIKIKMIKVKSGGGGISNPVYVSVVY